MANMNFGVNILPKVNNTYNLGNSDYKWANIYTIQINGQEVSSFAPKVNPEFSNSISMGRLANSTIGENSFAVGFDVTASNIDTHAEGKMTIASGTYSHAEGSTTTASSSCAHAEGWSTVASNDNTHAEGNTTKASGANSHAEGRLTTASSVESHAEGVSTKASGSQSHAEGSTTQATGAQSHAEGYNTRANGIQSHAEGGHTIAVAQSSHVEGRYNVQDNYTIWPEWTASTEYAVGDKVKVSTVTTTTGYICKTSHISDSSFSNTNWNTDALMNYIHIAGNGTADSARSNAYALDWDGNGHYKGDIYINCNADSTGGFKVATEQYVQNTIIGAGQLPGVTATDNGKILLVDNGAWSAANINLPTTMLGATYSSDGTSGLVPAPTSADVNKFLSGDGTYKSGGLPMVILSYGNSTWNDFITAYQNNVIVYCRASSNSNPASGSQDRMAFMAYVTNGTTTPTQVEFQYYRSVSSHSGTQMGDQVFVYTLKNNNTWTVTTREASIKEIKVDSSSSGTVSWSSNVVTLKSGLPKVTASDNGKILKVVDGAWAAVTPE